MWLSVVALMVFSPNAMFVLRKISPENEKLDYFPNIFFTSFMVSVTETDLVLVDAIKHRIRGKRRTLISYTIYTKLKENIYKSKSMLWQA